MKVSFKLTRVFNPIRFCTTFTNLWNDKISRVALILIVSLGLVNSALFMALRDVGLTRKFVHVPELDAPPGFSVSAENHDKIVQILRDTMNSVTRAGPEPKAYDPALLRQHAAEGGALMCAGMAKLFIGNLAAAGIPARRITLVRNLGEWIDSHSTVEVAIDGRWVVYDPTFNVSFVEDGRHLGMQEIYRRWISSRGVGDVKVVFYGDVKYPPRIENFHVSIWALVNHIFYEDNDPPSPVSSKILPVRYFYGPFFRYAQADNRVPIYNQLNSILLYVFVIAPFVMVSIICLLFCRVGLLVCGR